MTAATGEQIAVRPEAPVYVSRARAAAVAGPTLPGYYRCLAALAVFYVVTYGWLLLVTDGLPYVFDNNESFSSLWHAHNLYNFGLARSAGLTDEAYGSDPAAHPFVHTHQGNFPRLFATLIFALGATTVESQVVITTFTIGVLAVLFTYHFLATITRPTFALLVCLVLLTDYLGYAQWHVVTYRVWHLFLLFGGLLAVQLIGHTKRNLWIIMMVLFYLSLFYFELIFAAFTSITIGLYTAWRYRSNLKFVILLWIIQGVTAITSLSILITQLIVHLGYDVFLQDIRLTFFARNANEDPLNQLAILRSFYEIQNIVFFYNVIDVSGFRSIGKFFELHFLWHLQMYSPLFVLLVLTLVGGWAGGYVSWPSSRQGRAPTAGGRPGQQGERSSTWAWRLRPLELRLRTTVSRRPWQVSPTLRRFLRGQDAEAATLERRYTVHLGLVLGNLDARVAAEAVIRPRRLRLLAVRLLLALPTMGALLAFGAAGAYLATTAFRDNAIFGLKAVLASYFLRSQGFALIPGGVGACAAILLALRFAPQQKWRFTTHGVLRVVLASIFLMSISYFSRHQSSLYEQEYQLIWYDLISSRIPRWFGRMSLIITALIGSIYIMRGTRQLMGRSNYLGGLMPFLLVMITAYAAVYLLSPGYVYSGYLARGAPLVVFLVDMLIGVAVYLMIVSNLRLWSYLVTMGRSVGAGRDRRGVGKRLRGRWPTRGGYLDRLVPGAVGLRLLAGLASTGALAYVVVFWLHLQVAYLQLFTPQHYTFLSRLAEPPYAGASFAVNTYAAPIAAYTKQWAYISPFLAGREVSLGDRGFVQAPDPDAYVWFADRQVNPAYARPDYFLCIRERTWAWGVERLQGPLTGNCSDLAIVRQAAEGTGSYLRHRIVARDESGSNMWVVVQLDWELPPYLRALDARGDQHVEVLVDDSSTPVTVRARYQFAHQDGRTERGSRLRLVSEGADGTRCVIAETQGSDTLVVPAGAAGPMYVTVTPRTSLKAGPEYASRVFVVAGESEAAGNPCPDAAE